MHPSRTVFLVANEPWGDVWYSKQHYAHELARLGHQVYYVHPPSAWRPTDLFSFSTRLKVVDAGVKLVLVKNNLPVRFLPRLFQRVNDRLNAWKLGRLSRAHNDVLWWQFDPLRYVTVPDIPGMQRIYHIVDPYGAIPTDVEIARRSDLIVMVRDEFHAQYKAYGKPMLVVPHGISSDEQVLDGKVLATMRAKYGSGFMLFVGQIKSDLDLGLLERLVDALPDQHLMLIGPVLPGIETSFEALVSRKNVSWVGPMHANLLRYPIALSRLCIVPYLPHELSHKRTSLKVMLYLAQGRPVVSTFDVPLPDRERFGFRYRPDRETFFTEVVALLNSDPVPENDAAKEFARTVAYPALIARVLAAVDGSPAR